MHIYEPVPEYFSALEEVWRDQVARRGWRVELHMQGLGLSHRNILLSRADLKGQGTFGMRDTEADDEEKVELEIIEATVAVNNLTGGTEDLDLLHVNCEGCEYELLENIIKSGTQRRIK